MSSPSRINNSDLESVSSIDSFDPPPTFETNRTTRKDALQQVEDLVHEIGNLDFDQESLKPKVAQVLTEPVLRVLPPEMKIRILEWACQYDPPMFRQIIQFVDDDIGEWGYTVKVLNRRKDMPWHGVGADILRFFVADLKSLRKGLPEVERRTVVNNVRQGLSLFADFHDEKVGASEREAQTAIAALALREEAISD
ncbi:hypothetical protein FAUST_3738 [Fusarium austroamericanum]|uniref:Uncharacterized protein n=1 Tax=Fusarium austroamericanum TaxID=282268 RepID=A0AAN6HHK3_FUSAU|nr:hypothetical protein FAUST_3738 [Fusarium austroamericanum]